MCKRLLLPVGLSLCLLASARGAAEQEDISVWTMSSFDDFVQGHFDDAGANTYVSARGRVQLINRWDLNDNGSIDLVFVNSHRHMEKLDAAIYWGNGKDFDQSRMSHVPNDGAQWMIAADLDGNGMTDLVIPNYTNGTWTQMDSYVYYNGGSTADASGDGAWSVPPFVRKVTLPTNAAQQAAVGDLNNDGYPDIVFALSSGFWEYRGDDALASPSRVFWGSEDGYSRDNYLDLEAMGASDVALGDLNGNGWLDIVFANREHDGNHDIVSYVYFGGPDGFSAERRLELPTRQVNALALHDVTGNGLLDIIFANGQGPSSYIYVNSRDGFDPGRRIELPTSDARGVAAADLNGNGYADVFFTNHETAGNPWTLSYLYWGGPDGFAADRRQAFETIGAWGVTLADLNDNGRVDIVVSNYRDHYSFDVPSYIYWNSPTGFSNALRTSVFTRGAVGNAVADFNGNGHLDVVFNNTVGRERGGVTESFVYWGNERGEYSVDQRIELPGVEPYHWAAGDIHDNGHVDLIFANLAEVGRRTTESFIYWGNDDGFSPDHRSALVSHGARGVRLADLDRDGHLDVIFFNAPPEPGVTICWGSADGFVTLERTTLPGAASGLPTVADLNHNGHLDLVVPGGPRQPTRIYWGDGTRNYTFDRSSLVPGSEGMSNSEVADMNRDGYLDLLLIHRGSGASYVYYGNAEGTFSVDRRAPFHPQDTQGVTVADLNQDGWLDVISPRYRDGGTRATLSQIYLGGPQGLSEDRVLELPTLAGTGSMVADFNNNGYNDLLLICHRSEGDPNQAGAISDHVTESYLYWGGPDGLHPDNRLKIPTEGAHYDGGVDLGHVCDRSLQWAYISPPHEYGQRRGRSISWKASTPHGSSIRFQIRTAETRAALDQAAWSGADGAESYFETPSSEMTTPIGHAWIQYRAVLVSPNGAVSPILDAVNLYFAAP